MSWRTDFRYAFRSLRFSPGFAVVAILTLAVGIAVVTAMFTVVDGVLLKPLRYPDADRIVAINTRWTNTGKTIPRTTGGDLLDQRSDTQSFETFSYYFGGEFGVQLSRSAEFTGTYLVDPDYFRVFGVQPLAGRTFTADDAGRSVVVGVDFARRNFGTAAAALRQVVRIEGVAYEIVGVMPPMFQFPERAQVWAATSPTPELLNRTAFNYKSIAKLRPGVSLEAADAHLAAMAARAAKEFPDSNHDKTYIVRGLQEQLSAPVRTSLWVLMGAVGFVLLIACANVANLMLARSTARVREMAIRCALGASRVAVVRQLLTESLVIAGAGGTVGVAFAVFAIRGMMQLSSKFLPPSLAAGISLDWRMLGFAALASLCTSVIFGMTPAWQATKVNVQEALKQASGRGSVGGERGMLRSGLVVAQIALSVTLAVGAGLLFRTLLTLNGTDIGVRADGVLVTYAHMPAHTLDDALRAGRTFDDLFARLRALHGVTAAAGVMGLPLGEYGSNGNFAIEGKSTLAGDTGKLPHADWSLASSQYFSTMGIPLLAGRDFTEADDYEHPFVIIISKAVAERDFPRENPLGHRIMCGIDANARWMTIIGVVGDVRQDSVSETPGPALYMPLRQHPFMANQLEVVTRTGANPATLIPAVQSTIRQVNPEIAMKFDTMEGLVGDAVAAPRFRTILAMSFAGIALLLALAGMYAVMSYLTVQRTPEFGVRMALGARPLDVLRLVLGRAANLSAIGVGIGIALSIASSRLLATMLFGLKSTDPATYAIVAALALPVVVAAAALPAWRASRVEPVIALRNE